MKSAAASPTLAAIARRRRATAPAAARGRTDAGSPPTASPPATRTTPSIATNRNGDVAVVWEDDRDTDRPGRQRAQRDLPAAVPQRRRRRTSSSCRPAARPASNWRHISPDVGLDDRGNAVVVWAEDPDGNGFYNIAYRVVSPTGTRPRLGPGQRQRRRPADPSEGRRRPGRRAEQPAAVAFTVVWEDIQGSAAATVKAAGYTGADHQGLRGDRSTRPAARTTTRTSPSPRPATPSSSGTRTPTPTASTTSVWSGWPRRTVPSTLTRRSANSHRRRAAARTRGRGQLQRRLRRGLGVRPHRHGGRVDPLVHRDGTGRHAEVADVAGPAPSGADGRHRRPGATRSSAGPSPAPTLTVWVRGFNPDGTVTGRLPAQSAQPGRRPAGRSSCRSRCRRSARSAVAYTDDNDGNTFDQVILGTGGANSDW